MSPSSRSPSPVTLSSSSMDMFDSPPPPPTASDDDPTRGVGLSDPQLSHGRRKMLDMVNRLHSTGYPSAAIETSANTT
jgi:hypothetical protein